MRYFTVKIVAASWNLMQRPQSLKCPHCGEEQKIDANRSAVREHKLTAEARQMVRVQDKKSTTMQCPSCGAMVEVEPNSTAKDCPYCGTAFVLQKTDRCNRTGRGDSVPDR